MTEDGTGYEEIVVGEAASGGRDLRISLDSEPPGIRGVKDYGCGELKTAALDEIRERVELYDVELGEHVATVRYDLDAWTYAVEYTDETRLERLRRRAREVLERRV